MTDNSDHVGGPNRPRTKRFDRRNFLKGIGALGLVAAAPGVATSGAGDGVTSEFDHAGGVVSLARVRADERRVLELAESFDLTEHGRGGWFDVVLWPGDHERLERHGFEYRILVDDLGAADRRAREGEVRAAGGSGPVGGTHTYRLLDDYEADLAALQDAEPDLVRLFEFPHTSLEGRQVFGVEIGGPDVARAAEDGRPTALIMGLHHAREWPSGELTMDFGEELVSRYSGGDEEIVDLLDAIRVFIVPVVNPDGYFRSRHLGAYDSVAPMPGVAALVGELAYHRKNTRPRPDQTLPVEDGMGVDLNRNYPYNWGGRGASANPFSQTYFGPGPGSEPTIRNIIELISSEQILALVTNHTYSDLVLRPWGFTRDDPPDEAALKALGDRMASHNGYTSQKGIDLYPTSGTTEDWSYGFTGGFGYTFEIGSAGIIGLGNTHPAEGAGFHPQYNLWIPEFYRLNAPAYIELLRAVRDTSIHSVITGSAPAGTILALHKIATYQLGRPTEGDQTRTDELTTSMVVGPSGHYEWHVNPSPLPATVTRVRAGAPRSELETYTLTAALPDGTTRSEDVLIERGQTYTLDFPG